MKFNAAVLTKLKSPLVFEELEVPVIRFGQVLVKLICSGICGSQLGEIAGIKGSDPWIPHLLGHEACGEVLECGEGVTTVKQGDKVVLHWRPGTGIEGPPPKYQSKSLGTINAGWVTSFNELAVISENRLTAVSNEINPEHAALMGCAITTGLGVINNDAKVKIGQSVVIWGAGGLGLNMVQGAEMVSANPIIAVDLFDTKLELAKKLGATHVFNARDMDPVVDIMSVIGKSGADVVIDNTGNPKIIRTCYDLTNKSGRTILVGVPPAGFDTSIYTLPLHFEKTITGSHGGNAQPHIDIPNYINLIDQQKLQINPLITDRYNFTNINDAITDLHEGRIIGRCMVSF
jgi:S-(hydroxymethyl)glutathione dehydrogenase / alcohol dehydrogenase